MTATHGGLRTGAGRPKGRRSDNSVRVRLLDLLSTFDGEWLDLEGLVFEYSERFGPVSHSTLKRALYRIMEQEPTVMLAVRYVDRPRLQHGEWVPSTVIEVTWVCEIVEEET